jgi:hypothetical protein
MLKTNPGFHRLVPACALAIVWVRLCCGCADILDIPETPMLVVADPWECRSDGVTQQPPAPRPDTAHVRVQSCNFISTNCAMPVTGLTASLCNKKDYNCNVPLRANIRDANGELNFDVPTGGAQSAGFDGYLQVTPSSELCTNEAMFGAFACALAPNCNVAAPDDNCKLPLFVPGLLFFNPPVAVDPPQPFVLPMLPYATAVNLVVAAGAQRADTTVGSVFVTGLDCDGHPAAGLTFRISPGTPLYGSVYQANGVISTAATETDESGLGGLLGISAGFVTITAYTGEPGAQRAVASVGVQIVPSTVTYVTLVPSHP